ncbi:Transcriptional activator protein Pur-beta [Hondaea fermentalgiana]|uniref:Transcriptional activator protein Pur-beta n=1 Tax=Hondaea fermentalgiana TaxID=2315210 RepID=A0A2R5H178_9STRA|nr:Transcriptional activator protein Pur-beta [Hondaea fermentalgiana]|eukprot:GBG34084.1 Transcriptional activator protein Pur-beta [Hondaea fermentalgiana]
MASGEEEQQRAAKGEAARAPSAGASRAEKAPESEAEAPKSAGGDAGDARASHLDAEAQAAEETTQQTQGEEDAEEEQQQQQQQQQEQGQEQQYSRRDDLWAKRLLVNQRQYFFDVRENNRGKYLKLTEVSANRMRITVLVTPRVFRTLRSLLQAAIQGNFDDVQATEDARGVMATRYEDVGSKKYYIDIIHNKQRGRFIKIAESQASRGRSVVVLPEAAWLQTKRIFDELVDNVPDFGDAPAVVTVAGSAASVTKTTAPPGATAATTAAPSSPSPSVSASASSVPSSSPTPSAASPAASNAASPAREPVEGTGEERQGKHKHGARSSSKADAAAGASSSSQPPGAKGGADASTGNTGNARKTVIASRSIQVDFRRFFVDLLENDYGRTLKIAQLKKQKFRRETVMLPHDLLPPLIDLIAAIEDGDTDPQVSSLETMMATHASSSSRADGDNQASNARKPQTLIGRSFKSRNRKLFFLDLMSGPHGRFLRITESTQTRRTSVAFPDVCLAALRQVLEEFTAPDFAPSS